MLFVCRPNFCISIVFSFSWELKWPQEKLKTMLMLNFGVTNKQHYGMLWFFWSGQLVSQLRACLHGSGGPQVGEITRLGGVKK